MAQKPDVNSSRLSPAPDDQNDVADNCDPQRVFADVWNVHKRRKDSDYYHHHRKPECPRGRGMHFISSIMPNAVFRTTITNPASTAQQRSCTAQKLGPR